MTVRAHLNQSLQPRSQDLSERMILKLLMMPSLGYKTLCKKRFKWQKSPRRQGN